MCIRDSLVDTVTYKNLKVGETYTVSGVLMDKETGEPLLVGEQQVTAELEFTPTSSEGTVELTYTFDGSALAGKSVVVFEDLYQGENAVSYTHLTSYPHWRNRPRRSQCDYQRRHQRG